MTSIYEFLDALEFVRFAIDDLKSKNLYSVRAFQRKAGFGSPGYLQLLLEEKRNLTLTVAKRLAVALHLNRLETEYFLQLVRVGESKDPEDHKKLVLKLWTIKSKHLKVRINPDQFEFYADWKLPAIFEAISASTALDEKSLAESFDLNLKDLQKKLDTLEALGLIEKKKNSWSKKTSAIATDREIDSLHIRNFTEVMINRALHALDHTPNQSRDFTGLTVSVNEEQFLRIKERVYDCLSEIAAEMDLAQKGSENSADRVLQINVQAFPLAFLKPSSS